MKILIMLILFLVSAGAPAQEEPPREKPEPQQEKVSQSPEQLLEDLGSKDYATRSAAMEALRALGEKARKVLERGLVSKNVEQRTRARSLLDHLDSKLLESDGELTEPGEPGGLERLRRVPRVERDRALDPRVDLERTMREFDRLLKRRDRLLLHPFEDLRRRFKEMVPRSRSRESVVSVTRDGQQLELRRHADGKLQLKVTAADPRTGIESVKTYEARNLPTFKKQYPEIYEKYKDSGLFSQSSGTFSFRFGPLGLEEQDEFDGFQELLPPLPAVPMAPRPLLGIVVEPVPPVLRAHLPIPKSAVIVDELVPGSLAEKMGVRLYDIITHVDGRPVSGSAQIRHALARADHPETLKLNVLRAGKEFVLEGKWPGVEREGLKRK